MKKTLAMMAMTATAFGLVACTEEAKAATVYGSIEQGVSLNNGSGDSVGGDNYIGVKVSETLANGTTASAKIEMAYDSETDGLTNREAYVGLDFGGLAIQTGRMKNLEKTMVTGNVDVFEGNSFGTAGAARVSNAFAATTSVGGLTLGASAIADGAAGDSGVDAYEVALNTDVAGVNVGAVYTKDRITDSNTSVVSGSVDLMGVTVGAAYQPDADTTTYVGQVEAGNNTFRAGLESVEDGANTTIAEVQHNLSKSTSAYVNWSKAEDADPETIVAMRVTF